MKMQQIFLHVSFRHMGRISAQAGVDPQIVLHLHSRTGKQIKCSAASAWTGDDALGSKMYCSTDLRTLY